MHSFSIILFVFTTVCLVTVSGNEGIQFLSPIADVSNNFSEHQPSAMVIVESEEDKKLLLPLLAIKPLVAIAGGLLAGGKLNQKKPMVPKPVTTALPGKQPVSSTIPTGNSNVLVVIGSNDQLEIIEDEPRKLLLPILAIKPLLIASVIAGTKLSKLPAISVPKIGITITKHEYPAYADNTKT